MNNRHFFNSRHNSSHPNNLQRESRHAGTPLLKRLSTLLLAARPTRSLVPLKVSQQRAFITLRALLCLALLLGLLPTGVYAAPDACPASPSGLPDHIERTDFCVYYDDNDTTDTQATTVADHTQDYWDLYTSAPFGFNTPAHTGKLVIELIDASDCNGGTSFSSNVITINNGCFASSAESVQQTSGHELMHRVQYSYGDEVKWFKEGTARTMEDLAFTNIDHWANALMAPFSFNLQANEYLGNTNVDITSIPQRYNSALWWKYFAEQFGVTITEPQRGVDALLALWQAAVANDDIAAVNSALGTLGAGTNFDGAFRRFTAANVIKDLTNQPNPTQYNYIDEDEAGNPGAYGPIVPTNGGTINSVSSATFTDQSISRYGARYYRATPSGTDCPVVSATFHTDAGPAFYHVITQKGSALNSFASSTATDSARAFFNDGLTSIVAIVGSTNNSAQADVTLQCVNPQVNIVLPNNVAVAHVGPFDGPGKFLAQVQVTNGSPAGPVVAGLTTNDFKATVNGVNALITAGGFIQEQYWLVIQAPVQAANDVYDLAISLEKSGSSTVIASDSNSDSVVYDPNNTDSLLVIDRSGSMISDGKMGAAASAAKFYVDITRNNDGLAVIPFNEDLNPAPFTLRTVTTAPNVRQDAKNYIDGITASGLTSIGDGMREAVTEHNTITPTNPYCSFVLLSDGMENSAEFWSSVEGDAIATGCPVTSIAFGSAADETLMQHIASVTGGIFFYNDVYVSTASAASTVSAASADAVDQGGIHDTALDLGNVYEYAQASSEKRQRILAEQSFIPYPNTPGPDAVESISTTSLQTHTVMIDDSVSEALFALDWASAGVLHLELIKPDGAHITEGDLPYTFADFSSSGHVGWRIPNPDPGEWTMLVDFANIIGLAATDEADSPSQGGGVNYQVLVSGPSNLTVDMLLPDRLGTNYTTGQRVPLYAFISSREPISNVAPLALVTSPSGQESEIPLYDDGAHDDGDAGDGLYAGFYTLVNQAEVVAPQGESPAEPPVPNDEGSYRVHLVVQGDNFRREALGSFSVEEGADSNGNDLPDPYEDENQVSGDGADPDLDGLDNLSEYQLGTDPNNSDTDGGGENDGSEQSLGQKLFDPSDDKIVAPQFLVATPGVGVNGISYDVQDEYNQMILYRATTPNGPWTVQQSELPNTGTYSDTADNGTTYFYRYFAKDTDGHGSAVIGTSPATASADPFQPEAAVEIDHGAPTTPDRNVVLNFVPYGEELEFFTDIVEMKLSNDPLLTGADWQQFAQDVPWTLAATPAGGIAKVYAQFKDSAGNESLIVLGAIQVEGGQQQFNNGLFLPNVRVAP